MAGGVFHGLLYHLVSICQEDFCPVLGIRPIAVPALLRKVKARSLETEGCGMAEQSESGLSAEVDYNHPMIAVAR